MKTKNRIREKIMEDDGRARFPGTAEMAASEELSLAAGTSLASTIASTRTSTTLTSAAHASAMHAGRGGGRATSGLHTAGGRRTSGLIPRGVGTSRAMRLEPHTPPPQVGTSPETRPPENVLASFEANSHLCA